MIVHFVAFQAKPGKADELGQALAEFARDIRPAVPGIEELSFGPNILAKTRDLGYTHGTLVKFADKTASDTYQRHEVHQVLLRKLDNLSSSRLALDYEV